MNKWLRFVLKAVISVGLIGFLVWRLGFGEILSAIRGFNPLLIVPVIAIAVVNAFLGGFNIQLLLRAYRKRLPFLRTMRHYLRSWAYGLFLPSKIGEFTLMYFLKEEGVAYSRGFIISLTDKLITFVVLFCYAFAALVRFVGWGITGLIVLGIIVLGLIGGFFCLSSPGKNLLRKYILRRFARKLRGFSEDLRWLVLNRKRFLAVNTLITFAKWGLMFMQVQWIFYALGLQVGYFTIMSAVSIGILASLVPISIRGLGVTENISVELFTGYGVSAVMAGSSLLILAVLKYLQALLIFLFV